MLHTQTGGDFSPVHQTQILKHQESFGDIDYVLPNVRLFCLRTSMNLIFYESSKSRSPTTRSVSRTHRVDLDRLYDRINLDPMIQVKYVNTTQHPHKRIIHGKQMHTTDTVGEHYDSDLYSSNLSVSSAVLNPLFCSMSKRAGESFATSASAKQKPVHCSAMIATKISDKNVDRDYHAVPPPEYQAGGDSKRASVKSCVSKILKESTRRRQEHEALGNWKRLEYQAPGDRLLLKILQVKREFIFIQILMEKNSSGSSTILQIISSYRAGRCTKDF